MRKPMSLLAGLPPVGPQEHFDTLYQANGTRIERIVSHRHASPPGFWYDQAHDEWVMLLQGSARLEFVDGTVDLRAGDALTIAAHCRHRVAETAEDTVWLAVHIESAASRLPEGAS